MLHHYDFRPFPMLSQTPQLVASKELTSQFLLPDPFKVKTLEFTLKREQMTSPTMQIGPTNWYATASFDENVSSFSTRNLNLEIFCHIKSTDKLWECEANVKTTMKDVTKEDKTSFSNTLNSLPIQFDAIFESEEQMIAMMNEGTLTLEIEVHITKYLSMMDFSKPDPHLTQCALLVEGHKLYINKYLLAENSSYFYSMFFSGFAEKDKKEIEIKDVGYKEFLEFLNICYKYPFNITAENLGYLLKLGDRFQHRTVMDHCDTFLDSAKDMNISVIEQLQYSTDYRLDRVQRNCLIGLYEEGEILDACSNYDKVTPETAHILFEKLMNMDPNQMPTRRGWPHSVSMFHEPPTVVDINKLTSQFVLPDYWGIETMDFELKRDPTATRKHVYSSPEMKIDSIYWCATVSFEKTVRTFPTVVDFNVEIFCNKSSSKEFWECDANIQTTLQGFTLEGKALFSNISKSVIVQFRVYFETEEEMMARLKINDETLTLQMKVDLNKYRSEIAFSKPVTNLTQCALLVEGHKLYINKYLLAQHSPYFYAMFFSGFEEENNKEIEMKDVVYEEFVEFLKICHNLYAQITSKSIGYLLKLGNIFEHKPVMDECVKYLELISLRVNVIDRLQYAHDYKLPSVQSICLNKLNTEESILNACSNYDYDKISPEVAHLLFEKLMKMDPTSPPPQ